MKRHFFFIIALFISLVSIGQTDEYYRTVDWKFYPDSIVQLTDSTWKIKAIPYDYNDPGAINRTIGNYVVDFVGHRFVVIDSTSTTITVKDIHPTGQAPQTGQVAHCYRSVGNGEAQFIGSVDYTDLDASAEWKIHGADKELLWRKISSISNFVTTNKDTIHQISHGFSVGNAIYLDDKFYKANANDINTSDVVGIIIEVISTDIFVYAYSGKIPGSYTEGENYFLSNSTSGAIIPEPIYEIGDVRQFIGTGQSDGSLLLEIDIGYQISEMDSIGISTGDTISSMYYSNDTLFVTESGNVWKAEIVGGSGGGASLYEKELANNETVVNTGILLDANCIVLVNGEVIPTANWSGEGTMNVTLSMLINQYDNLIVYKSALPISEMFEAELANNQTTIDLGFIPNGTTIIFFNGEALQSDRWTALGTEITLDFPVSAYDKLIAKN